jgi:SAM-dependent methyltransferase
MFLKYNIELAKRSMAIFLSLCLIWTCGSMAEAAAIAPEVFATPSNLPQFQLAPPGQFGRIADYYNAPAMDSKLVVLIQDLHAHYGVQKNIAGILDSLSEKLGKPGRSGVPFALAVEGAAGPIDSSVAALFPDAKVKEEAAQYLMRQGELTGAEYFAIKRGLPNLLVGVEDGQYYAIHRDLFRKTFENRNKLTLALKPIQKEVASLPRYVFRGNKALWDFRKKMLAHDNGEISTHEFIALLTDELSSPVMRKAAIDLKRDFPALASFASNAHFGTIEQIRAANTEFLNGVQGQLSAEEKSNLKVLAKGSGTSAYYLYLRDLVYKKQLFLAVPPELAQYMEYIHTAQTMGMDRVLFEAKELAYQEEVVLAQTGQADAKTTTADLVRVEHDLNLLTRLADLQATELEVRSFAPRLNQFVAMCQSLKLKFDEPTLRRLISSSIDFYAMALLRNQPMIDNTLALIGGTARPSVAVLVTGGFHTNQLASLLRQRNASYIVITPTVDNITEQDHELYVKRLNGQFLNDQEVINAATNPTGASSKLVGFFKSRHDNSLAVGLFGLALAPHVLDFAAGRWMVSHHADWGAAAGAVAALVLPKLMGKGRDLVQNWASQRSPAYRLNSLPTWRTGALWISLVAAAIGANAQTRIAPTSAPPTHFSSQQLKLSEQRSRRLMDTRRFRQSDIDANELSGPWLTQNGFTAKKILEDANTPADKELIAKVLAELTTRHPDWLPASDLRIIVSDHLPPVAMTLRYKDGRPSVILLARSHLLGQGLPPMVIMSMSVAHESGHDAFKKEGLSPEVEEALCLRRNVAILEESGEQGEANITAWFLDRMDKKDAPVDVNDESQRPKLFAPYQAAINALSEWLKADRAKIAYRGSDWTSRSCSVSFDVGGQRYIVEVPNDGGAPSIHMTQQASAIPDNKTSSQPAKSITAPPVTETIRMDLAKLHSQLMDQAKTLPPAIHAIVQKAVSEDIRIQADDKSAVDILKRTMGKLQDDLFAAGFLFDWDILTLNNGNSEFVASFFELREEERQTVPINVKGQSINVKVYPRRFFIEKAAGSWLGTAFPERHVVLLDEYGIRSDSRHLQPGSDIRQYFGVDNSLGQEVVREAFSGKSEDEIFSVVRQGVVVHEVLHVYFDLLKAAGGLRTSYNPDNYYEQTELASYLGELALARNPYVDLLFRLRGLYVASGVTGGHEHTHGHTIESADAIFRGLAFQLGKGFKTKEDRDLAQSIGQNTALISISQATSFFQALRRNGISDQEIRDASRRVYNEKFGELMEDLKPVASLFNNSPLFFALNDIPTGILATNRHSGMSYWFARMSGALKRLGQRDAMDEDALNSLIGRHAEFIAAGQGVKPTDFDGQEVVVIEADLPDGMAAYHVARPDGTPIIVLARYLPSNITTEAIFHELHEAHWMTQTNPATGRAYTQHEAHVLASAEQAIHFGHFGSLTKYHQSQIDGMSADQLKSLISETADGRLWHHDLLRGAGLDVDRLQAYESRLRDIASRRLSDLTGKKEVLSPSEKLMDEAQNLCEQAHQMISMGAFQQAAEAYESVIKMLVPLVQNRHAASQGAAYILTVRAEQAAKDARELASQYPSRHVDLAGLEQPTVAATFEGRLKNTNTYIKQLLSGRDVGQRKPVVVDVGTGYIPVTTAELADHLSQKAHVIGVDIAIPAATLEIRTDLDGKTIPDQGYGNLIAYFDGDGRLLYAWHAGEPLTPQEVKLVLEMHARLTRNPKRKVKNPDGTTRMTDKHGNKLTTNPFKGYERPNLEFRQGGFNLPLRAGETTDLIRLFNVIQYYPGHEQEVLDTLAPYLNEGGHLVVGDVNANPFFFGMMEFLTYQKVGSRLVPAQLGTQLVFSNGGVHAMGMSQGALFNPYRTLWGEIDGIVKEVWSARADLRSDQDAFGDAVIEELRQAGYRVNRFDHALVFDLDSDGRVVQRAEEPVTDWVARRLANRDADFQKRFYENRHILKSHTTEPGSAATPETILHIGDPALVSSIPMVQDLLAFELAGYHVVPTPGDLVRVELTTSDPRSYKDRADAYFYRTEAGKGAIYIAPELLKDLTELQRAMVSETAHAADHLFLSALGIGPLHDSGDPRKSYADLSRAKLNEALDVARREQYESGTVLGKPHTQLASSLGFLNMDELMHERAFSAVYKLFEMVHSATSDPALQERLFNLGLIVLAIATTRQYGDPHLDAGGDHFSTTEQRYEALRSLALEARTYSDWKARYPGIRAAAQTFLQALAGAAVAVMTASPIIVLGDDRWQAAAQELSLLPWAPLYDAIQGWARIRGNASLAADPLLSLIRGDFGVDFLIFEESFRGMPDFVRESIDEELQLLDSPQAFFNALQQMIGQVKPARTANQDRAKAVLSGIQDELTATMEAFREAPSSSGKLPYLDDHQLKEMFEAIFGDKKSTKPPEDEGPSGTPASLLGVAAAASGASSRAVKIWSWMGLILEVAAGAAAWHFGTHGSVAFLAANAFAALHIPLYYKLSQRGPPGSIGPWQYAVPFLVFNAYAAAAVLTAHAFVPAALIMFTLASIGQIAFDAWQIPRLAGNAATQTIRQVRDRDSGLTRRAFIAAGMGAVASRLAKGQEESQNTPVDSKTQAAIQDRARILPAKAQRAVGDYVKALAKATTDDEAADSLIKLNARLYPMGFAHILIFIENENPVTHVKTNTAFISFVRVKPETADNFYLAGKPATLVASEPITEEDAKGLGPASGFVIGKVAGRQVATYIPSVLDKNMASVFQGVFEAYDRYEAQREAHIRDLKAREERPGPNPTAFDKEMIDFYRRQVMDDDSTLKTWYQNIFFGGKYKDLDDSDILAIILETLRGVYDADKKNGLRIFFEQFAKDHETMHLVFDIRRYKAPLESGGHAVSIEFPAYLGQLAATLFPYWWLLIMGQDSLDRNEKSELRIIMNRILKDLARQLAPHLNLHAKAGDWDFKDLKTFLKDLRSRKVSEQQIRDAARDLYRRTYKGDIFKDLKIGAEVLERSPQIMAFSQERIAPHPALHRPLIYGTLSVGRHESQAPPGNDANPESSIEQNRRLAGARQRLKDLVRRDDLFLTVVNQMREKIAKELNLPPTAITQERALQLLDSVHIEATIEESYYARATVVDGHPSIRFNTQYAGSLSDDALLWVLAHEFGHILFRADTQTLFDWRLGEPLNKVVIDSALRTNQDNPGQSGHEAMLQTLRGAFDGMQKQKMARQISDRYQAEEDAADQVGLLMMWPAQKGNRPGLEHLDLALARCEESALGPNAKTRNLQPIDQFLKEIGVETHPPSHMRGRITNWAKSEHVLFLGLMIPEDGWGRWLFPVAVFINKMFMSPKSVPDIPASVSKPEPVLQLVIVIAERLQRQSRKDGVADIRTFLRDGQIPQWGKPYYLSDYARSVADDLNIPLPEISDWQGFGRLVWDHVLRDPGEVHRAALVALEAQIQILNGVQHAVGMPDSLARNGVWLSNALPNTGLPDQMTAVIDEARRIWSERAITLDPADPSLAAKLESLLAEYVEWPARRLVREVLRAGFRPVSSNAFGDAYKGIWFKDDKTNNRYFIPLAPEDYVLDALRKEPLVLTMQQPVDQPGRSSARTFSLLRVGRIVAMGLFVAFATVGLSISATAQNISQTVTSAARSATDIDALLKPLTPDRYELLRGDGQWGQSSFADVSYQEYLAEYRSLEKERSILARTLARWKTDKTYGQKIWNMLADHPHPIILTHHLPKGFGGAMERPLGIMLLGLDLSPTDTPEKDHAVEFELAYYIGHELLHEVYPHETETQVHGRSIDLVTPIRDYDGISYSRGRSAVKEALAGDQQAADLLAFKLEDSALEDARGHVFGPIDAVMSDVEDATGIPRTRIVVGGVFKMSEVELNARDQALAKSGQHFTTMSKGGFLLEADHHYYWVWIGDGKHQVLKAPDDVEYADPAPLMRESTPAGDSGALRLVAELSSELVQPLGELRRMIAQLVSDPQSASEMTDVVNAQAARNHWTDETLLNVVLQRDGGGQWIIQRMARPETAPPEKNPAPVVREPGAQEMEALIGPVQQEADHARGSWGTGLKARLTPLIKGSTAGSWGAALVVAYMVGTVYGATAVALAFGIALMPLAVWAIGKPIQAHRAMRMGVVPSIGTSVSQIAAAEQAVSRVPEHDSAAINGALNSLIPSEAPRPWRMLFSRKLDDARANLYDGSYKNISIPTAA